MIKRGSESYRIIKHFLNEGPLSAAEACQIYISNNLRSRIPELVSQGFDIVSKNVEGKSYCEYFIPPEKLEKNREHFAKILK